MSGETPESTGLAAASLTTCWAIRVLAMIGGGVAGYLLILSIATGQLPPGCGSGSGCEEVLTSRWAVVAGPKVPILDSTVVIPVSGPALVAYLGILASTICITPRNSPARQKWGWAALIVFAAAICTAALWFVSLQWFVIGTLCKWCMAEHGVGLATAGVILGTAFARWHIVRPFGDATVPLPIPFASLGMVLVGLLAWRQIAVESHPQTVKRIVVEKDSDSDSDSNSVSDSDSGPGPDRAITVLNGNLQLSPHELPTLGSPDADVLLVVLFDYCCPHCQTTHGYLIDALDRYGDKLGIVSLPMPLDAKCNRSVDETGSRFEHACELAELALAVFKADPKAFPEFDTWLYESEMPRELAEARLKAEELVSTGSLERALADPWVRQRVADDIEAYIAGGAESIPVIMSPGFSSIVGRPESAAELYDILEKDLKLSPSAAKSE